MGGLLQTKGELKPKGSTEKREDEESDDVRKGIRSAMALHRPTKF